MKKIYSISAIVLVAGTLAAYLFGQIDGGTFTAVTTSIGALLFGLYQKFEKGEVLKENLILKRDVEDIAESLYKERVSHQELLKNQKALGKLITFLERKLKETQEGLYTEKEVLEIAEDQVAQVKKTRSKKVK